MKTIIEYDNIKLKNISDELYNLFLNNSYDTLLLGTNISQEEKNTILNNENNYFLLSNKINSNNNIEIIYPLKDNNQLAIELDDKLSNITVVNKYYQLRSLTKTNLDYYEIFRNLRNNNGIIIKYGDNILNNQSIPQAIFQVINNYLNNENIYTVKSGDSLYSIARKFNTSVDELKKVNNLSSNLLSIGDKLIIPNNQNNNTNDNIDNNTYTVKSGDSLYSISKKFNTSVDELKKVNNLSSNLLSIGDKLIIPNNQNNNTNDIIDNNNNTYTVKSGDSLYSISKKFNTSVDELKKVNNLSSNLLSIGDKLIIPNNQSNNDNSNSNTYTVKSGDSLYSIARKYNITVDKIKSDNNLTKNLLSIGQKLIIKK